MKKIIDVSSYNSKVDWASAKKQGISGAILKIIRKDLDRDNQFNNNYKGCESAGVPWGVYNYSYATTESKAKSDMNLICDILDGINKKYFSLGIWFDIEDKVQASLSKSKIAAIINSAQKVVEDRGYNFGVYTGLSYYKEHMDTSKITCKNWWIARYYKGYDEMKFSTNPNESYKPISNCFAWQYTSSGTFSPKICSGNGGKVDISVQYKEFSDKEQSTKYDRSKIISIAKNYIGTKEGSSKHKEIVNKYNTLNPLPQGYKLKTSDSWCAAFATVVFMDAGYSKIFPNECGCERMIEKAKDMGIWVESDAYVAGLADCILYDWDDSGKGDNTGWADHIGIITDYDSSSKTYTVTEGNKDNKVGTREIKINGKFIRGFICPKFNGTSSNSNTGKEPTKSTSQIAQEVIDGKWGNGTDRKKALEKAGYDYEVIQDKVNELLKKKDSKDDIKVDGEWGTNTTKKAQKVFKTKIDGVVSNQLIAYKSKNPGIVSSFEWQSKKSGYSPLIKAIQKWCGAEQDGLFGTDTAKKMQKKLGCKVDGYFSKPSPCIKEFQKWLNKQ